MAGAADGTQGRALMLQVATKKALGAFTLDAAFDAPAGVTAIFGRSGSGKTSIINAVAATSASAGSADSTVAEL